MIAIYSFQEILHTKYNIEWIPTLIFIDGKTGKVISENGDSIIENDPTGDGFPWKPKPFSEIVTNAKFIDQNEKAITWEELQGKIIGLFFSSYSVSFCVSDSQYLHFAIENLKRVRGIIMLL